MATEESETHVYRAKDGLFYETYEEMRAANVRVNQQVLDQMGLLKNIATLKPTISRTIKRKRKSVASESDSETTLEQRKQLRRSTRCTTHTQLFHAVPPLNKKPRRNLLSSTTTTTTTTTTMKLPRPKKERSDWGSPFLHSLREKYADQARNDTQWFSGFQQFWKPQLRDQSFRTIVRQAAKLANGQGIVYAGWPADIAFMVGEKIDMSMNYEILYKQAIRYEHEYGVDKGHGWLLRIPLRKLFQYQKYYLGTLVDGSEIHDDTRKEDAKALLSPEIPPSLPIVAQRFPLGTRVEKIFPGFGTFKGRLDSYDRHAQLYHVTYDDGDWEELEEMDILALKPQHPSKFAPIDQQDSPNTSLVPNPMTSHDNDVVDDDSLSKQKQSTTESIRCKNASSKKVVTKRNQQQQQQQEEQQQRKPRFAIGTTFVKEFEGFGSFIGRVESFEAGLYRVVYPMDGDFEDLEEHELIPWVVDA